MHFYELGRKIRHARLGARTTQGVLAQQAGLGRTTVNLLESGIYPDLGIKKVVKLLNAVGLDLAIVPLTQGPTPDFLRMACVSINVSLGRQLTADDLANVLFTGKVPSDYRPHLRVFFEEVPRVVTTGAIAQVAAVARDPARVSANAIAVAHHVGCQEWGQSMTLARAQVWESLFRDALDILDAASSPPGVMSPKWTVGGGTMLMRKYRHRVSKDIDIFFTDPQWLARLTPRLSATAETKTNEYVEQSGCLKLYLKDGEIDFIAAGAITRFPFAVEDVLGRRVRVETDAEIIAKKVHHRAAQFKARDIFDLACVIERNEAALATIHEIFASARTALLDRIQQRGRILREDFQAIDMLDYTPTYDAAVERVTQYLQTLPT